MTKKVTSKKRKFSLSDIPTRKLRAGTKVQKVNSAARLREQELVFRAFWQRLVEQDIESFKDILRETRQNPSLLRKRILDCSPIFAMWKNPQCITADTLAVFPHRKNRISTRTSAFSLRVGFASLS